MKFKILKEAKEKGQGIVGFQSALQNIQFLGQALGLRFGLLGTVASMVGNVRDFFKTLGRAKNYILKKGWKEKASYGLDDKDLMVAQALKGLRGKSFAREVGEYIKSTIQEKPKTEIPTTMPEEELITPAVDTSKIEKDVIDSLTKLGYKVGEVQQALKSVFKQEPNISSAEDALRKALKFLKPATHREPAVKRESIIKEVFIFKDEVGNIIDPNTFIQNLQNVNSTDTDKIGDTIVKKAKMTKEEIAKSLNKIISIYLKERGYDKLKKELESQDWENFSNRLIEGVKSFVDTKITPPEIERWAKQNRMTPDEAMDFYTKIYNDELKDPNDIRKFIKKIARNERLNISDQEAYDFIKAFRALHMNKSGSVKTLTQAFENLTAKK